MYSNLAISSQHKKKGGYTGHPNPWVERIPCPNCSLTGCPLPELYQTVVALANLTKINSFVIKMNIHGIVIPERFCLFTLSF